MTAQECLRAYEEEVVVGSGNYWMRWSAWWFLFGIHLVCTGVGIVTLFRTDLRIPREYLAYPIKSANYSSSKEGLVD